MIFHYKENEEVSIKIEKVLCKYDGFRYNKIFFFFNHCFLYEKWKLQALYFIVSTVNDLRIRIRPNNANDQRF